MIVAGTMAAIEALAWTTLAAYGHAKEIKGVGSFCGFFAGINFVQAVGLLALGAR